jgi:hypothetical protein
MKTKLETAARVAILLHILVGLTAATPETEAAAIAELEALRGTYYKPAEMERRAAEMESARDTLEATGEHLASYGEPLFPGYTLAELADEIAELRRLVALNEEVGYRRRETV